MVMQNSKKKRIIKHLEGVGELLVYVYLIGYYPRGESILVVVKSNTPKSRILYVAVIDCFEESDENITIQLLEEVGVEKPIDLLCWTHPHDDHTVGMGKILEQYCDKSTRIIIPNILMIQDQFTTECTNFSKLLNTKLTGIKVSNRYDISSYTAGSVIQKMQVSNTQNTKEYELTVRALSPYDAICNAQFTHSTLDPNKFSIALLFELNTAPPMNLLFCSDIEDSTIECFATHLDEIPSSYNYIKLPHHCSDTSIKLFNYLNKDNPSEVACTTVFKDTLPKKSVLVDYKKFAKNIYCTSNVIICDRLLEDDLEDERSDKVMNLNNYGVIEVHFNVTNNQYSVKRRGKAVRIKNEFFCN